MAVCLLVGAAPSALQQTEQQQPRQPLKQQAPEVTVAPGPPVPPVTFADPDGQELILEELSARTAIHGMLALTELEFRFRNPQNRRIEGRFTCTLPPNAAISRFAKDVNGHLMEGEVVERLRANQVYEQFLHQMRDPALLEQDQGNRFSARIFPIEANAPVQLVLSYTTLLPLRDGVRTYTLPLRGLPKIDKLTFRAFVSALPGEEASGGTKSSISGPGSRSTAEVVSFEERGQAPSQDVVLTWRPTSAAAQHRLIRAGDFYVAAFRPAVRTQPKAAPSSWLFYVDTSASSAEGAPHRIRALERVLASLPAGDRVELVAFDQDLVPLGSGSAAEMSRRVGSLLNARLFLGGTDLQALFRAAAREARERPAVGIVVASDLVATLGETDRKALTDAMASIPRTATLHSLILGSREDGPTAKALTAGRGRVIRVPFSESLESNAASAAAELRRPLGSSFDVSDPSAEWLYPTHFDDVTNGDEVIVLGKVKAAAEPRVQLGGQEATQTQTLQSSTFAPLLEREAYRAYLDYLAEREANEPAESVRRALATEQVRISVEQRVVIPRTTMLVLESEWEYQRFGLDRRALAAILTIGAGGIERIDRTRENRIMPVAPPARPMPMPMRREKAAQMPPSAPVDLEAGVEGTVSGGVVGGAVGGVLGGVEAAATDAAPPPVAETTVSHAPMHADVQRSTAAEPALRVPSSPPPPPPRPAPVPPREEARERKSDRSWLERRRPSSADIAALEAKLRDNPRDRELYNQLSEALAALGEWRGLRALALRWQPFDPENPQVYEALGLAGEQLGNETEAARAHASLIEIAPAKTELLQRAGLLLMRSRRARLAEAPLRKALEVRPDRANGYRHLALMLWRDGRVEEAARVLESATRQSFPNWYGNVQRVIREELGYVYRAWMAKEPSRRAEIEQRARDYDVDLTRRDAMRVTLAWETDANDVDLHVVDPSGEECYYSHKQTRSGLTLYEDITQGLGPEVVTAERLQRGTYHVGVRYFAAGPMGVSRGIVVVLRGDDLEIHPFRLVKGGGEIRYVAGVTVK